MSELEARSISNVSDSYISSNSQSLISYVNTKSKHSPSYSIDLHNDAVGEHSSYSYGSPLASSSNISEKSASPFNDYNLYTNGLLNQEPSKEMIENRKRNNDTTKKSSEKRRFNDMAVEQRLLELTKENHLLKSRLEAQQIASSKQILHPENQSKQLNMPSVIVSKQPTIYQSHASTPLKIPYIHNITPNILDNTLHHSSLFQPSHCSAFTPVQDPIFYPLDLTSKLSSSISLLQPQFYSDVGSSSSLLTTASRCMSIQPQRIPHLPILFQKFQSSSQKNGLMENKANKQQLPSQLFSGCGAFQPFNSVINDDKKDEQKATRVKPQKNMPDSSSSPDSSSNETQNLQQNELINRTNLYSNVDETVHFDHNYPFAQGPASNFLQEKVLSRSNIKKLTDNSCSKPNLLSRTNSSSHINCITETSNNIKSGENSSLTSIQSRSVLGTLLSTRRSPTVPQSRTELQSGLANECESQGMVSVELDTIDLKLSSSGTASMTSENSSGKSDSDGASSPKSEQSTSESIISQSSPNASIDKSKNAKILHSRPEIERYMDRRRRNNEAAKRCRANRRAVFEYRSRRAQKLEIENGELRQEMIKLSNELEQLKAIITANNRIMPT